MNEHRTAEILLVEDDVIINQMEERLLRKEGYKVTPAFSGTEALLLLERKEFDLIILDLMIPGLSGEEVLEKVRKDSNIPILIVSAKDDMQGKVWVLRHGADDYILKPFDNDEFLARVDGLLRRSNRTYGKGSEYLTFKDIKLDNKNYQVYVGDTPISLTKREFLILELLMKRPNQVFTKNSIYEAVWNEPYFSGDNAVNVHISNLRAKLSQANPKESYIETVWGIGFKMCGE